MLAPNGDDLLPHGLRHHRRGARLLAGEVQGAGGRRVDDHREPDGATGSRHVGLRVTRLLKSRPTSPRTPPWREHPAWKTPEKPRSGETNRARRWQVGAVATGFVGEVPIALMPRLAPSPTSPRRRARPLRRRQRPTVKAFTPRVCSASSQFFPSGSTSGRSSCRPGASRRPYSRGARRSPRRGPIPALASRSQTVAALVRLSRRLSRPATSPRRPCQRVAVRSRRSSAGARRALASTRSHRC